jgi:DNA uptake protein ComE-like DNA-binding protein
MMFKINGSGLLLGTLLWAASATLPAQVAVPAKPQAPPVAAPMSQQTDYSKLVDVNSASRAALMKLPGIDKVLADKIIAGRPYYSKAKLVTKHVISFAVFQGIRGKIYTGSKAQPKP